MLGLCNTCLVPVQRTVVGTGGVKGTNPAVDKMEALKRALLGCTDPQSVPGCCAQGSCKELEAALGALGLGKGTLLPLPSPEQCFESGVSHWRAKKPGESSGILSPRWVFRRCCSCAPCKEPAKQDGAQLKGHCRDPSLLRSPPPQCCPGTARLHLEGSGGTGPQQPPQHGAQWERRVDAEAAAREGTRVGPSAGAAEGAKPTYVKLGHAALHCISPALVPGLNLHACRLLRGPEMLHLLLGLPGRSLRGCGQQLGCDAPMGGPCREKEVWGSSKDNHPG